MRVGIIALQHESNTFLPTPTTLDSFRAWHMLEGEAVREVYAASHHELGGFLEGLAEAKLDAVPIFAAWAMPGGTITAEAFESLVIQMLAALERAGPLDGLLVAPHGAAVSERELDADGCWLTKLRERLGPRLPMIGTLDPHANVSPKMVAACDALIAYRTNPHLDQRPRGVEAARLMARTLRGEIRPVLAAALPPLAINIERQLTSASPCRELYALADKMLTRPGVLSNSVILGFPYADVPEMGSGALVVADGRREMAQSLADELAAHLWRRREEFVGQLVSLDDAIARAAKAAGPIGLLDMGDNVGGGSPADSTWLLDAAIRAGSARTFACLYDPAAVSQIAERAAGETVDLDIGGKTDQRHGPTLHVRARLVSLHDGKFSEPQVRHGGQTRYDMGPSAVIELSTGQTVLLTSRRMAPFSLAQLTSCGIEPSGFQALVIKGVHAPVAAYAPVCRELIRVDTPGVTRADMTRLDFHHRRRPLFPFERADSTV